jgi:hypothetical protein
MVTVVEWEGRGLGARKKEEDQVLSTNGDTLRVGFQILNTW